MPKGASAVKAPSAQRPTNALSAALVGCAALGGYLATLHGFISFWDTGELETVPYILGIAHPTACPAFVLLGWLFTHALPFGSVAQRVDAMCALAVAGSVALLYLTLRRFEAPQLIALVCAVGFAFAPIPWRDATRAEVQDLDLLFRVLALWFGLRWSAGGRQADLFALALFAGLACATHGLAVLVLPALVLLVLCRTRSLRPSSYGLLAAGFVAGLLPYAYLPLRSAYVAAAGLDPTGALGLPPGMPFWDYDHPATLGGFLRLVTGADFDTHSGFAGFWDVSALPHFSAAALLRLVASFGWLGACAATLGMAFMLASRRLELWALLLAALLPIPYTESYTALMDPDRYYLLSLWCAAVAIGIAMTALLRWAGGGLAWRTLVAAALTVSFALDTSERRDIFLQRDDVAAAELVSEIQTVTPAGAIIVAEWGFATPLAYASYVERSLDRRIVVSASPDQFVAYYPKWLARGPLYVVSFSDAPQVPGYGLARVDGPYNVFRVVADPGKAR